VKTDIYVEKLSKDARVAPNVIKSEIYGNNRDKKNQYKYNKNNRVFGFKTNKKHEKNFEPVIKLEKNGSIEIEKNIISLCLSTKTNYKKISSKINDKDFLNNNTKNIFCIISDIYANNEKIDFMSLVDRLDIEDTKLLKELEQRVVPFENLDKTINDLLISLKHFKIKNEIELTKEEIMKLEKIKYKDERNVMKIKELWKKLDLLGKELKNIGKNQIDLKGGKSYE
jgi:DNA primase